MRNDMDQVERAGFSFDQTHDDDDDYDYTDSGGGGEGSDLPPSSVPETHSYALTGGHGRLSPSDSPAV
jgi:hypothetical protein